MNLYSIDLNLLVALEALLAEQSVTQAAQRVGLSQSAMSHALGRLRDLFGDPLLVRAGRSMVLTPRAQELAPQLEEVLVQLRTLISPPSPFDPETSTHRFVVAANDYALFVLLPRIVEHLASRAPGIDLRVRALGQQSPKGRLENGEIDVALTLGLPEHVPDTLFRRDLFQLNLVCVVRQEHPRIRTRLTLEDYAREAHVLVSPRGDDVGVVDVTLHRLGHARRVAVVVPHFMLAPHLIAQTDYVLTTAESVARAFEAHLAIRLLEPPVELERGTVSLVWHERTQHQAPHRWFRQLITDVYEEQRSAFEDRGWKL